MKQYFIFMMMLMNVSNAIACKEFDKSSAQTCCYVSYQEEDEGQCQTLKTNGIKCYEFRDGKFFEKIGFEYGEVPQEFLNDATRLAKKLGIKPKEVAVSYFAAHSSLTVGNKRGELISESQLRRLLPHSQGKITKKDRGSLIALYQDYPIAFQRMDLLTLLWQHDYANISTRISHWNPQDLCCDPVTEKEHDRIKRMYDVVISKNPKSYKEAMQPLDCYRCFDYLAQAYDADKEYATIHAMNDKELQAEREKNQRLFIERQKTTKPILSTEPIPTFEQLAREAQEKKLSCEFHTNYPENENYIDALGLKVQHGKGRIRLKNILPRGSSSSDSSSSSGALSTSSLSSSSSSVISSSSSSSSSSSVSSSLLSSSSVSAPLTTLALLTIQKTAVATKK